MGNPVPRDNLNWRAVSPEIANLLPGFSSSRPFQAVIVNLGKLAVADGHF
jgi:hypothetical protein